jgi:hypothetical protein
MLTGKPEPSLPEKVIFGRRVSDSKNNFHPQTILEDIS